MQALVRMTSGSPCLSGKPSQVIAPSFGYGHDGDVIIRPKLPLAIENNTKHNCSIR